MTLSILSLAGGYTHAFDASAVEPQEEDRTDDGLEQDSDERNKLLEELEKPQDEGRKALYGVEPQDN